MKFSRFTKKAFVFSLSFFFSALNVFAGIKFGEGDINYKDELLFTVKHEIPGTPGYRTLFKSSIRNGETELRPEILTCYPEQMELIKNGSILQIRNRYGIVWYNPKENTFTWKQTVSEIPYNSMRISPYSISPNGTWACYVSKKDYASGFLTLENLNNGKKVVIDEKAAFSYRKVPVKWNKDSSILLYEKDGNIYFCNPEAMIKDVEAGEEHRKIGQGSINCVEWSGNKYFIYIDGDMVYRINSKELYTLGLYSGIIGKGTSIGRLPYRFDPAQDKFSINADMTSLVIVQDEKNFTWYRVSGKSTCDFFYVESSRPFITNTSSPLDAEILWSKNKEPSLWLRSMPYNSEKTSASVFKMNDKFSKVLDIENSGLPSLSPDGTLCAFYSGSTIYIYSTDSWKKVSGITGEKIECLVWDSENNLFIGGDKTIKKLDVLTGRMKLLMLSSVTNGYFNDSNRIIADTSSGFSYIFNEQGHFWSENGEAPKHTNITRNENYRLFLGQTQNENYENTLYIRNLKGKATTKPVLEESTVVTPPRKKAALAFDAYDNADGIAKILYELDSYNVKGTFFLNGEFIRRYPNETNQIAGSKNDCASMFFTTAKLISSNYLVDENYIRRGLARNEDEFFQCTGRELSLYWHAPYYTKIDKAVQAGKETGYTYADANCNGLDTVTLEESASKKAEYKNSTEIIDIYMSRVKKNPSSVISISTGISRGERESYLYEDLDLLLSALLDEGFDIVMVSDLIK